MGMLKFLIATWYIQLYTPIYGFWAVHGVDSLHVWVCGDSGMVVQTENGGNTWAWHYIGKSVTLEDIWFVTDKIGWVVGDSNIVAKTVDGGNTWTVQVVGDSGYERFIRVQFIDSLIGWIGGKYLYRTEDGGLTWHKYPVVAVDFTSLTVIEVSVYMVGTIWGLTYDIQQMAEIHG